MIVVEVQFTAVVLPELFCGDVLLKVLVELHLFFGDGVDERRDKLEEGADIPRHCNKSAMCMRRNAARLTLGDESSAESLRVVVLQDVQDLSSLADTGSTAAGGTLEVDKEGSRLLSRAHHVDDSIQHERKMVNLAVAVLCVLLARIEVQTRASVDIVTHDHLLARLVLRRNVIGGESVGTILASPRESSLQTLEGAGNVPLGSAKVTEKTLAGQPHALVVCDRLVRGIFESVARECGPCGYG